jgi:hypothetical protein
MRGELVRADNVEEKWTVMIAEWRAKLLALPTKLAQRVAPPGKTPRRRPLRRRSCTSCSLSSPVDDRRLELAARRARAVWAPPPKLTVSQWSDEFRYLSPESSAEPGKWSTATAEYQRGIMDAVTDPANREIWVKKSAQVGWTDILGNVVAYYIDQDPSPMLLIQPTLETAETWSKDRLAPMLRDTPRLRERVKDARSRDSGNTLLHKQFPAGTSPRPARTARRRWRSGRSGS